MVDNTGSNERRLLKKYMARYYQGKQRQEILRNRLAELRGQGREAEEREIHCIEQRFREQVKAAEASALEIMDMIELLPEASTERIILELRHIDCKPWQEIRTAVHLTRSPCYEYYKRGLDELLNTAAVRQALGLAPR